MTYAEYVKNHTAIIAGYKARNTPDVSKCKAGCPFYRPVNGTPCTSKSLACHFMLDMNRARGCAARDCDLAVRRKEHKGAPTKSFFIPPRSEDMYI